MSHAISSPLKTWARSLLVTYLALCSALFSATAQQNVVGQLGTNLSEVNDYSHQLPFNNIFLYSREWITQCRAGVDPGCTQGNAFDTDESALLDLDSSGWVRSLPSAAAAPIFTRVATFWDIPADFPSGQYVVLYEGSGTLEYELGASKDSGASSPGRDVININPANGGVLLRIASTNPANYVRNIRVVKAEDEALLPGEIFTQRFLNRIKPYAALRFMDWMRTNNSVVSSWSSRSNRTDARYSTPKGVPVEIMVDLCNATQKSPWFTMPHLADDAYIQSFAEQVKTTLSGELPVYVEYSNEAWNSLFSQGSYIEQQGLNEWPSSSESSFTKRINWYGKRSAQICDIWKQVFLDSPARVVCITASQAANSWTADEALRCPLWNEAPCVAHGIGALAIAPYFGDYLGQEEAQGDILTWTGLSDGGLGRIFSEIRTGGQFTGGPPSGSISQSLAWVSENKQVADNLNVSLLAYEGGQHLVGVGAARESAQITELFTAANRDSRMEECYSSYLSGWGARGGGLFMHFTDISDYSKYGSWGALEAIDQVSSPKLRALANYAGVAVPAPPPSVTSTESRRLRVSVAGAGVVKSSPGGINCKKSCSSTFQIRKRIVLTARPSRGAYFRRWSGDCRSLNRRCIITMSKARRVQANFGRLRP